MVKIKTDFWKKKEWQGTLAKLIYAYGVIAILNCAYIIWTGGNKWILLINILPLIGTAITEISYNKWKGEREDEKRK